jgi:hypothetical protein
MDTDMTCASTSMLRYLLLYKGVLPGEMMGQGLHCCCSQHSASLLLLTRELLYLGQRAPVMANNVLSTD